MDELYPLHLFTLELILSIFATLSRVRLGHEGGETAQVELKSKLV